MLDFAVSKDINETEDQLVRTALEAVAKPPDAGEELTGRESRSEEQRVEPPNNTLFSKEIG